MESAFKAWRTSRSLYLKYFENYSLDQLNKTPEGFSNNLIWNIGHIIVIQQRLVYKSADLPGYVSDDLFKLYQGGTKPTGKTSNEEVSELKLLLVEMIDKTESDFASGKLVTFNERVTNTGFHLASLEDAIQFNNYHEAMHLGFMMNIRKFV